MPFDVGKLLNNLLYIIIIVLLSLSIYYLINIGNKKVDLKNRIVLDLDTIKRGALTLFILFFALFIFNKYPIIIHTVSTVIIGSVIAYLINPLVDRLEKKGINRTLSIVIVYIIIVGIFVLLVAMMVPSTVKQVKKVIYNIPNIIDTIEYYTDKITSIIFKNNSSFQAFNEEFSKKFSEVLLDFQSKALDSIYGKRQGSSLIKNLSRLVLIPVVSFYFIMDKEKILDNIKSWIPEKRKSNILRLAREIDNVNSEFVRGRLIMALFVGLFTGIFLFIMRIDFAIVIGIITCIADIIPYIGPFLGFVPAFVLALMDSPFKAIIVAIVFVLLQWVENNIIAPKVLGKRVGLNPLVILLCLIIGGGMFGFVGMIFAVPVVATIKTIFNYYKENILSFIFKEDEKETIDTRGQ